MAACLGCGRQVVKGINAHFRTVLGIEQAFCETCYQKRLSWLHGHDVPEGGEGKKEGEPVDETGNRIEAR